MGWLWCYWEPQPHQRFYKEVVSLRSGTPVRRPEKRGTGTREEPRL